MRDAGVRDVDMQGLTPRDLHGNALLTPFDDVNSEPSNQVGTQEHKAVSPTD